MNVMGLNLNSASCYLQVLKKIPRLLDLLFLTYKELKLLKKTKYLRCIIHCNAHSRSLINTDWMNAEVERRDLEAHRVISRNLKHAELRLFVLSPAWNFSSPHPTPFFLQVLGFFFVFFLICCHALLYGKDQDFQEASFGRGRMFIVGKRKKNWRTIVIWY